MKFSYEKFMEFAFDTVAWNQKRILKKERSIDFVPIDYIDFEIFFKMLYNISVNYKCKNVYALISKLLYVSFDGFDERADVGQMTVNLSNSLLLINNDLAYLFCKKVNVDLVKKFTYEINNKENYISDTQRVLEEEYNDFFIRASNYIIASYNISLTSEIFMFFRELFSFLRKCGQHKNEELIISILSGVDYNDKEGLKVYSLIEALNILECIVDINDIVEFKDDLTKKVNELNSLNTRR